MTKKERNDKAWNWSRLWQKTSSTEIRFYPHNGWCAALVDHAGDLQLNVPAHMACPVMSREEALKFAQWIKENFDEA